MGTIKAAIEAVQSAIIELEEKDYLSDLTGPETEALTVLRVSYEILARTAIAETIIDPEATKNLLFKHTGPDTVEEFVYRLISGYGDISFRNLLEAMLRKRQIGTNRLTQIKISEAIDISSGAISAFINNKYGIHSATLEKIINYILQTQ